MNKKTHIALISSFFIIIVLIIFLIKIENKTNYIEFKAVVIDTNLVSPLKGEKIKYDEVSALLNNDVKKGDIINLKIEKEILEIYPPVVTVISYEIINPTKN